MKSPKTRKPKRTDKPQGGQVTVLDRLGSWSEPRRACWWIGVVALLLYANALGNGFTFDDHSYIAENQYNRSWDGVAYLFFHPLEEGQTLRGHLYRPFPALVQRITGGLLGFEPWPFHALNVVLYALNALTLLLLLRRLFDARLAAVATAVFLVHPIHTEVVASAVGMTELLAFQGGVLSLLLALDDRPTWLRDVLAGLAFLLALLSKETSVIYPAVALAVVVGWRRTAPLAAARRLPRLLAVFVLPLFVYLALRYHVIGTFLRAADVEFAYLDNPLCGLPGGARFTNALVLLARYLAWLVVPWRLSADYSYAALPVFAPTDVAVLAAAALHVALAAAGVWWLVSGRRLAGLAVASFYLGLLPASNLVFCGGTVFGERFLYLPSVGFALVVEGVWQQVAERRPRLERRVAAAVVLLLLAFALRTVVRNRDWADDLTLFESVRRTVPGNAKAWYNVALLKYRQGNVEAALEDADRAAELYPAYVEPRILLAEIHARRGETDVAERLLREAVAGDKLHEDAYVELGVVLAHGGRLAEAVDVYRQGLEALPASPRLAYNLGMTYMELGEPGEAEPLLRRALEGEDFPDAHYALGRIALGREDFATAAAEMHAARPSEQRRASAVKYEAFALSMDGRFAAAIEALGALREDELDPDHLLLAVYARYEGGDVAGALALGRHLRPGDCGRALFPGVCERVAEFLADAF